jgi:hypothetical protein
MGENLKNPKPEYRNTKQTLRQINTNPENPKHQRQRSRLEILIFGHLSLFRASNLDLDD